MDYNNQQSHSKGQVFSLGILGKIGKIITLRPIRLRLPATFACLVGASVLATVGMFLLQADTHINVFSNILDSLGLVFLLNWLPVLFCMLFLFFVSGRVVLACGITGLVCALLAIVNRYMIAIRLAPFKPLDILLGAEFLGVAHSIKSAVFIAVGIGLVLFAVLFAACLYFLRNQKPHPWVRGVGAVLVVAAALWLNHAVYANVAVYRSLPCLGNMYNEMDQFQSKGFLYCYIYAANTASIVKPPYYDDYLPLITAAETQSNPQPDAVVNFIFILSEAFSEMPIHASIDFTGFDDPLRYYKTLKAESITGSLIVPHAGGGTADTEFDIFTGLNTRDFSGLPYAFYMMTNAFPSVLTVFKNIGYTIEGIHPGAGWFYNRQNVYPYMGADRFIDHETIGFDDMKGGYITEARTFTYIMEAYEQHLSETPTTPYMACCITIQNHGPYVGKYGASQNFNTDLPLTANEYDALANYFEGIADCDRELQRLIDYLREVDAPTVLVYYSDHLPGLSYNLYDLLLDMEGDPLAYNRVPYLVWGNDAAWNVLDKAALRDLLPETVSASYVGAALLSAIGVGDADPFLALVNDLRGRYPILLDQIYYTPDGTRHNFDPETDTDIALYKSWSYYRATH